MDHLTIDRRINPTTDTSLCLFFVLNLTGIPGEFWGILFWAYSALLMTASIFAHILPYSSMFVHIRQCWSMYVHVRPYSSIFVSVQPCSSKSVDVRPCSSMFVHIHQCSSMFVNVRRSKIVASFLGNFSSPRAREGQRTVIQKIRICQFRCQFFLSCQPECNSPDQQTHRYGNVLVGFQLSPKNVVKKTKNILFRDSIDLILIVAVSITSLASRVK